jgi:hypothetical protein
VGETTKVLNFGELVENIVCLLQGGHLGTGTSPGTSDLPSGNTSQGLGYVYPTSL